MRHSVLMLSVAAALLAGCQKQEAATAPQPAAAAATATNTAAQPAAVIDQHSYA